MLVRGLLWLVLVEVTTFTDNGLTVEIALQRPLTPTILQTSFSSTFPAKIIISSLSDGNALLSSAGTSKFWSILMFEISSSVEACFCSICVVFVFPMSKCMPMEASEISLY